MCQHSKQVSYFAKFDLKKFEKFHGNINFMNSDQLNGNRFDLLMFLF